jgi:uncharacterized SAM-dependent methyltransferase
MKSDDDFVSDSAIQESANNRIVCSVNEPFLADMRDLFARRKFAHVGNWRYSESMFPGDIVNGLEIWNRITERAKAGGNYYIFSDEVDLIANSVAEIIEHISENTVFIDLGPGSKEAIVDKVGVVLERNQGKIVEYIAVDLVPEILKNAESVFADRFARIKYTGLLGDMFKPLNLPEHGNRLAAIFGQTMFNIAINPHDSDLAKRKIVDMLTALKGHLRPGERIIVPQNCSEDEGEIRAAYREQEEVWLNLFHRVKRDLPIEGDYDPEGFIFEPYWIASSNILSHTAVPKKAMQFKLGLESVSLGPQDRFYMHNTVICPVGVFEELARSAELKTYYRHVNNKGRMALHILEAAT